MTTPLERDRALDGDSARAQRAQARVRRGDYAGNHQAKDWRSVRCGQADRPEALGENSMPP